MATFKLLGIIAGCIAILTGVAITSLGVNWYVGDMGDNHVGNHIIVTMAAAPFCAVQYGDSDGVQSFYGTFRHCELP